MRSREYNVVIEFWEKQPVTDGIVGFINVDVFLFKRWAKITTSSGQKFRQFGMQEFTNPIIFSVRDQNIQIEENFFIKYKGEKYFIKGVDKVNLEGVELNIFCDGN